MEADAAFLSAAERTPELQPLIQPRMAVGGYDLIVAFADWVGGSCANSRTMD